MIAPLLLVIICLLGVYFLIYPGLLTIPTAGAPPLPGEQTTVTTAPATYDEIHARYGNQYNGYEDLIRRTASGGFDTREADAAMAGQPLPSMTGTPAHPMTPRGTTPVTPGSATGEIESDIAQYTNDERRANGVPPLQEDPCLREIARAHSGDMAANRYFSHEDLLGQDSTARAAAHGCPTTKPLGGGWTRTGIGENIGKMPTGNVAGHGYVPDTPGAVARAQVDSWMASPGHRQNILNPSYSHIGVGTARDASGYYLSTQDFW